MRWVIPVRVPPLRLLPHMPGRRHELLDHVVGHILPAPEVELAPVGPAGQLGKHKVRVRHDVGHVLDDVLPDTHRVVAGVYEEARHLDFLHKRLLLLQEIAAVVRAAQPPLQAVRLHDAVPRAQQGPHEVVEGRRLRPQLLAVPEDVEVPHPQADDPARRRPYLRRRTIRGHVVPRIVGDATEYPGEARALHLGGEGAPLALGRGPHRQHLALPAVPAGEPRAAGEAHDGHRPAGLPCAHRRQHLVQVLVQAEHREPRLVRRDGHAAVAPAVHHDSGEPGVREVSREVPHGRAGAVHEGPVQQDADRQLLVRGRAARQHPV
mmetsp:Transcript_118349/g.335635  ORF Transcript_118349/g.335635 Transcript_118349/m.335635 type:complete len:321 (+) Transcript_118349:190-1152(+)